MQYLDPNTLFAIFEQGDEQIYREHGVDDALKNPYVLMGMTVRGVDNYHMMDMMYLRQYPEQYKNVRKAIKYKYFNKLYSYLEKIDSKHFDSIYKVGESFEKGQCFVSLDYMLKYYESLEQYEKCAVIKRFQDLLLRPVEELYEKAHPRKRTSSL